MVHPDTEILSGAKKVNEPPDREKTGGRLNALLLSEKSQSERAPYGMIAIL